MIAKDEETHLQLWGFPAVAVCLYGVCRGRDLTSTKQAALGKIRVGCKTAIWQRIHWKPHKVEQSEDFLWQAKGFGFI